MGSKRCHRAAASEAVALPAGKEALKTIQTVLSRPRSGKETQPKGPPTEGADP